MAQDKEIITQLEEFLELASPKPYLYEACHHFAGTDPTAPHLVFGFCIHGNEFGTLPALLQLQRELGQTTREISVTLLLGNVDAIRKNTRFVEEDFNRVFTFDRNADSLERVRAERVRPILDRTDFFLDFHQTQTRTRQPFYTFPWYPELANWARLLALAPVGLTRAPNQTFSQGQMCLDEYVRARGKVGLTIELGTRGQDSAQALSAASGVRRALKAFEQLRSSGATLSDLANQEDEIDWYETAHIVRAEGPDLRLRPGLENWSRVAQGETLTEVGSKVITSPFPAVTLFPKYPARGEPPPPELVRLARPVVDPSDAFGSSTLG